MVKGAPKAQNIEQQVFWDGRVFHWCEVMTQKQVSMSQISMPEDQREDCISKSESRVIVMKETVNATGVNELSLQTVGYAHQETKGRN